MYKLPPRLTEIFTELGISETYPDFCRAPMQMEAEELVFAGKDIFDRDQFMTPETFSAWQLMLAAATNDNITVQLVSAYRDFDYQCLLIRRKLERGDTLDTILKVNTAPGFSEHHTGRALDLTTPGCEALETEFEDTAAFQWLAEHAVNFGFSLSYPRNNVFDIDYEPWHWAYRMDELHSPHQP